MILPGAYVAALPFMPTLPRLVQDGTSVSSTRVMPSDAEMLTILPLGARKLSGYSVSCMLPVLTLSVDQELVNGLYTSGKSAHMPGVISPLITTARPSLSSTLAGYQRGID